MDIQIKKLEVPNVLYSVVYGNMLCQVGTKYFFKLDVDRKEKRYFMRICKNLNLLERVYIGLSLH